VLEDNEDLFFTDAKTCFISPPELPDSISLLGSFFQGLKSCVLCFGEVSTQANPKIYGFGGWGYGNEQDFDT
jgi:hypothetical protein